MGGRRTRKQGCLRLLTLESDTSHLVRGGAGQMELGCESQSRRRGGRGLVQLELSLFGHSGSPDAGSSDGAISMSRELFKVEVIDASSQRRCLDVSESV